MWGKRKPEFFNKQIAMTRKWWRSHCKCLMTDLKDITHLRDSSKHKYSPKDQVKSPTTRKDTKSMPEQSGKKWIPKRKDSIFSCKKVWNCSNLTMRSKNSLRSNSLQERTYPNFRAFWVKQERTSISLPKKSTRLSLSWIIWQKLKLRFC